MTFEVLRFETLRATDAVAVLELEGAFDGLPPPARPRLLVEGQGQTRETAAVDAAAGEPWSATFAVPLVAAVDPRTSFALVSGGGPIIALPAPTRTRSGDGTGEDRHVELARGANDLRHRASQAADAAEAAAHRTQEALAERDRLAHRLAEANRHVADAERSAREAAEQREALRTDAEGALREANALRETVDEAHEETEEMRARIVVLEDEIRHTRRELREARARVETLRRERPPVQRAVEARPTVVIDAEPLAQPEGEASPPDRLPEQAPDDAAGLAPTDGAGRSEDEDATADAVDAAALQAEQHPLKTAAPPPELDEADLADPARVGARLLEPVVPRPPSSSLTPARLAAATALLVVVALAAILVGGGLG